MDAVPNWSNPSGLLFLVRKMAIKSNLNGHKGVMVHHAIKVEGNSDKNSFLS
jgi:hypothetical protein